MNTAMSGGIVFPYGAGSDAVQLVNPTHIELYTDMQESVQKVWKVAKDLTKTYEAVAAPIIVFEAFDQLENQYEWLDFQESWKSWWGPEAEEPFNAKVLPAYYYKGTPYIQMRPSFVNEGIRPSPIMPEVFNTKHALYTIGHEMHHYLLDLKGVDLKLHHCLMVRTNEEVNYSLNDKLYQRLIGAKLIETRAMIMLNYERRTFPCRYLSEKELAQVDSLVHDLHITKD